MRFVEIVFITTAFETSISFRSFLTFEISYFPKISR